MKISCFSLLLFFTMIYIATGRPRRIRRIRPIKQSECLTYLTGISNHPGLVRVYNSKVPHKSCTGIDIGNGHIITAAHCIDQYPHPRGHKGHKRLPRQFRHKFTISYPNWSKKQNVIDFEVHYTYSKNENPLLYFNDYAILRTTEAYTNTVTLLENLKYPDKNETCYVSTLSGLSCLRTFDRCRENDVRSSQVHCLLADRILKQGDSGSPVFCETNGTYQLRGVLSTRLNDQGKIAIAPIHNIDRVYENARAQRQASELDLVAWTQPFEHNGYQL